MKRLIKRIENLEKRAKNFRHFLKVESQDRTTFFNHLRFYFLLLASTPFVYRLYRRDSDKALREERARLLSLSSFSADPIKDTLVDSKCDGTGRNNSN